MGTENYVSGDFEENITDMIFNRDPSNLVIDRDQSYTRKIKTA